MLFKFISSFRTLKSFHSVSAHSIFCRSKELTRPHCYTRKSSYVNVYMKWKKDPFFDSIESVNRESHLKPLVSLINFIAQADPNFNIPISTVSKKGVSLEVPMKVARFLRLYPSVFEEFVGPQHNHPWFKLTPKVVDIHLEEKAVYEKCAEDLRLRLKKLIAMSKEKMLPLRIIKGVQWYLGLPYDFLSNLEKTDDGSFRFVETADGERGLTVCCEEKLLSLLQMNAIRQGVFSGESMEPIPFPFFPPKGLRLKRVISGWLDEFQKLPYVSPYEDPSHLRTDSNIAEKRVVGVLHELLSLFVNHTADRRKLLCLKKYLGLPQKFHRAFERHINIFYLSLRDNTCTVVLKEGYRDGSAIERHPLAGVREKYVKLMKESEVILKRRRQKGRNSDNESMSSKLNVVQLDEDGMQMESEQPCDGNS